MAGALTATQDPYAAIRRLKFTRGDEITRAATAEELQPYFQQDHGVSGGSYFDRAAAEKEGWTWVPTDEGYAMSRGTGRYGYSIDGWRQNDALNPFASKYEEVEDLGDGRFRVRMQRPGMHKYDTMDVIYRLDPATGEAVMEGDPSVRREVSSMQQMVHDPIDVAAKIGGSAAALYGAGWGLSQLLPAATTAATTATTAAPAATAAGNVLNPALIESAVGTAGYGASSAGAGGVLGTTAAGSLTAEQIATMAANGMTDAEIASVAASLGDSASYASLTGTGFGVGDGGWSWGSTWDKAKDYAGKFFSGGGGGFSNSFLRDALGLIGAGVQQYNVEKMAEDQRNWQSNERQKERDYQDKKESDKRRRQAPAKVAQGVLVNVPRGS